MASHTAGIFDLMQLPDLVRDTLLDTTFGDDSTTTHLYRESAGRDAPPRREVWKRHKVIGAGGFGTVRLEECVGGRKDGDPTERAVKEIRLPRTTQPLDYRRELEVFAKFSQAKFTPFFAKSFGWFYTQSSIYLALEYFPLGDLGSYLHDTPVIAEHDTKDIIFQILQSLDIMHQEGFAHRDLKPENILLKSVPPRGQWWIKLTDFGLSKRITNVTGLSAAYGTEGYASPEVLFPRIATGFDMQHLPHDAILASDIWSLGEIAFRIVARGRPTFEFRSQLQDYVETQTGFPVIILDSVGASPYAKDFVQRVMAVPYHQRMTAETALKHVWIKPAPQGTVMSAASQDHAHQVPASVIQSDIYASSAGWSTASSTKQNLRETTVTLSSSNTPSPSFRAVRIQYPLPLPSVYDTAPSPSSYRTFPTALPRGAAETKLEQMLELKHSGNILNMQTCSQTNRLAIICDDNCLQIWDTSTGAEICRRVIPEAWPSVHTAFSRNLRWLLLSLPAASICLYDLQNPLSERVDIGYVLGYPSGCAFSPDCQRIATIHHDARESFVNIWDTSGQSISRITIENPSVFWISFLPVPYSLIAVSRDGKVYLLDIRLSTPTRQWKPGPAVEIDTAVLCYGGRRLLVVSYTMFGFIVVLDDERKQIEEFRSAHFRSVACDSRNDYFALLDRDGRIEISGPSIDEDYDLSADKIQTTLERPLSAMSIDASWLAAETSETIVTLFKLDFLHSVQGL